MVHIPELNGLTQARRLADASLMAREWITLTTNLPLDEIAVTVAVDRVGAVDVSDRLAAIREQRDRSTELERDAMRDTAQLAKDLAAAHVPVRDIGWALGVSFQRAHQLVHLPS
jgi:hypothetical protein